MANRRWLVGAVVLAAVLTSGCSGEPAAEHGDTKPADPKTSEAPKAATLPPPPKTGLPTIIMTQAQFTKDATGKPVPGPAKMVLWSTDGAQWYQQVVEDPGSNVFHKGIAWRDGILTIGAEDARLVHWKREGDAWKPNVMWTQSWGGKYDRLRDLEIGDVTGDGKEDLVLATHDQGVVAVGTEGADGAWTFTELGKKPDTFVHEIEIGDLDGDGKNEFYSTPSERNRASGESQPGGVGVWSYDGKEWKGGSVVEWKESHAKEILVADVTGDGKHELYAAREAHTEKDASGVKIIDPVRIVRLDRQTDGTWKETTVATLQDRQCRFLAVGDVDGDGKNEMVAAGYKSGLYVLEPNDDGTFTSNLIDAKATGFENATVIADLGNDGKLEIYEAADDQKEFRRYQWNGTAFDRTVIGPIPENHITWNLQAAGSL